MIFVDLLFARRQFALPHFDLPPLQFEQVPEDRGELVRDRVVAPPAATRTEPCPPPTPGELRDSIERHLRGGQPSRRPADAADELRDALAKLRRSLG